MQKNQRVDTDVHFPYYFTWLFKRISCNFLKSEGNYPQELTKYIPELRTFAKIQNFQKSEP